jgi:hypothetical protein
MRRSSLPERLSLSSLAFSALAAWSCVQGPDFTSSGKSIRPDYDPSTGRLTKLAYDSNGDGTDDTWGYMDGARVIRVESDENGDGRVDRWEFHRAPDGPTERKASSTVERVEQSTRRDGRVQRWEFYDAGVLSRVEDDTNGDGQVDKWETYSRGSLAAVALDTVGRGTPDRRLVYRPDGSFERVEIDPEGSGSFRPVTP